MDNRRDARFTLLIRAAKLIAPNGEYMCILRDASVGGVRAQIFHPLPPGKDFTLELPNGDCHAMEVVWERDGHAGFRFRNPVELPELIGGASAYPKRPVRLQIQLPAQLSTLDGRIADVTIRNLSQYGMRIDCAARLAIDQVVRIDAEQLPSLTGRIRWRGRNAYGLVLDHTFRFEELARLVGVLQQGNVVRDHNSSQFNGLTFDA